MKTWSKHWKASKNPSKQRKYVYQAPSHIRSRFLNAHLAKDLKKKYTMRSITLRKGDKVQVLRGQFKGSSGKVSRVDTSRLRVFVDGVHQTKTDGSKSLYPLHPSNLLITELHLEDKKRIKKTKKE